MRVPLFPGRGGGAPNQEPEEEAGRRRQADQPAISTTRPLLLSAVDERTNVSGLYRVAFNAGADPTVNGEPPSS